MSIFPDLMTLIQRLPPDAILLLAKLVRTILASSDPHEALRRAQAAASEQASEARLKKMLK